MINLYQKRCHICNNKLKITGNYVEFSTYSVNKCLKNNPMFTYWFDMDKFHMIEEFSFETFSMFYRFENKTNQVYSTLRIGGGKEITFNNYIDFNKVEELLVVA